jgi:8-oxo-dGTP pyrophosphatase MutT (NUDIX family)
MAKLEFSAGGVVIKGEKPDPRVLLIKDSYGRWTWPKGKLNKGETPEQAAVREIGEETGLRDIELISKIGMTEYFYRLRGKLISKTVYIYLFKLKSDEKLNILYEEIQDGAWFKIDESIEKIEYAGAKEILKRGIENFLMKP